MNTYERVKDLLINNPELRDNQEAVLTRIWEADACNKIGEMAYFLSASITTFLDLVKDHKLTKPDSVFRYWRLVQKNHPELRGLEWQRRQRAEKEVREEIKEITL